MSPKIPVIGRSFSAAVLLFAPPLGAQTQAPGDVLAKLVPEGTIVYVQAPSLEKLDAAFRKVIAAFDREQAGKFDIDEMLRDMKVPGSPKEIDHQKPVAFCLVLPAAAGGEPTPTFLVPAVSAASYARSIAESDGHSGTRVTTAVEGSYVSVSMSPDSKRGAAPAPIALGLPAGEVVARIDLKRFFEHFRPMIDMGLGEMQMAMASLPPQATGGLDIGPLLKIYAEGIRSVVDSGETLDLALRLDGNRVEIASALTAQEKSALADFASKEKTDTKVLARFLDPSSAIGMLIGMDSASMVKRLKPLIDASLLVYPEPMRSDFRKMMESYDELAAQMGSSMCSEGGFGAEGMRFAVYLHPRDPQKLLSIYKSMLKSMPTISVTEAKEETVDGQAVTRMRIQIDAKAITDALAKSSSGKGSVVGNKEAVMMKMIEKLYGKDGLDFTIATKGDVTAVVLGGDEAFQKASLARMSSPGHVPAGIARGLEQVGDLNPCFLIHYDFGRVMHELQGVMGEAFQGTGVSFPDVSASITSWLGVDGRVWRSAMSADLAELGAFATAVKNSAMKLDPPKAKDGSSPSPEKKGGKWRDRAVVVGGAPYLGFKAR